MFGKSKKPEKPDTQQVIAPSEGELILEQLFTDELPASKPRTVEGEVVDAEFIEVSRDDSARRSSKRRGAAPRRSLFGLGRRESPAFIADSAAGDTVDSVSDPDGELLLDITAGAVSEQPTEAEARVSVEASDDGARSRSRKPKKEKLTRAPKASKTRVPRRRAQKDVYLVAQIAGDRQIYWRLAEKGVEPVDALPAGARAISFSKDDLRFETDQALSHKAAEAVVLQEVGEAVYVLNRSKELKAVYATFRERVEKLDYRIGPGALVIDRLVRSRAPEAEALVVGLELKDSTGRDALLILYYLSATGQASEPQVSVYPEDRDFLLSQFAAAHQAARENAQVLMLDYEALLEAAAKLELYPNEPALAGIPLRKIWTYSAAATVILAIASAGWAYHEFTQHEQARRQLTAARTSAEFAQRETTELLNGSPRALARGVSLNVSEILSRSHAIWVPGARVQFTADGTEVNYRVTLPLIGSGTGASRATAARVNTQSLEALLHVPTPADCERSQINFSGTFNEAQLNIRCPAPAHPLDRYRGN